MVCVACGRGGETLCRACRLGFRSGTPRRVPGGLLVIPAFEHNGTARRLVHQLKYQGSRRAAEMLAQAMARGLPDDAESLVPVPRSWARRLRFGIDPAHELARVIGRRTGLPVKHALGSPFWASAYAGRERDERRRRNLHARRAVGHGAVLVDDVVTTGGTLGEAATLLSPLARVGITATGAGV